MTKTKTFTLDEALLRVSKKGKLEQQVSFGPESLSFKAWVPIGKTQLEKMQDDSPDFEFPENYPKIPYLMHRMVMEYYTYVESIHQSEAVVLFHFDFEARKYDLVIPTQVIATGSHVSYNSDIDFYCTACHIGSATQHDQCPYCDAENTYVPFNLVGTTHSHGKMGAFHSSTDDANELNQTGFHTTYGHVDKDGIVCPSYVVAVPGTTTGGMGTRFLPHISQLVEDPFAEQRDLMDLWSGMIVSKPLLNEMEDDDTVLILESSSQIILCGLCFTEAKLEAIVEASNLNLPNDSPRRVALSTKKEAEKQALQKKQKNSSTTGITTHSTTTYTSYPSGGTTGGAGNQNLRNVHLATNARVLELPGLEDGHLRVDDLGRCKLYKAKQQAFSAEWYRRCPTIKHLGNSWGVSTKRSAFVTLSYLYEQLHGVLDISSDSDGMFQSEVDKTLNEILNTLTYKAMTEADCAAYLKGPVRTDIYCEDKNLVSAEGHLDSLIESLTDVEGLAMFNANNAEVNHLYGILVFFSIVKDYIDIISNNYKMPDALFVLLNTKIVKLVKDVEAMVDMVSSTEGVLV